MKRIQGQLKKVSGLMWVSILIVILFMFTPGFAQARNFNNILKNSSILAIASIGMTMSILAGEIDMSIGGVMSASGMIAAMYIAAQETVTFASNIVALLIGILVGLVFGIFNGLMISRFRFNFWLVTFSTMSVGYGLSAIVTNGYNVAGFDKVFRNIADGKLLNISTVIYFAVVLLVIMCIVLYRTRFGMYIYAIGDSEQCARETGISVVKVKTSLYAISGALAGLCGVLLASKTNLAGPSFANGYEFDAIAAVVIGGTPFEGGKGGLIGTIVGVVVLQAIKVGLQCLGLTTSWQQTLIGFFILGIIIVDVIINRRKHIKQLRREYKDA